MKKQRMIVLVLAVAVIGGLGVYSYVSPDIWLLEVKKAAEEGDKERLRDLIDFDSVKTGLKEDIKTQLAVSMVAEIKESPFAALGVAMVSMIVDPMVDMIVSPSGMTALIEGQVQVPTKPKAVPPASSSPENKTVRDGQIIKRGYDNFSRYRIRIQALNLQSKESIVLTLKRDGLFNWKLIRISLPSESLRRTEMLQRPNLITIEASDMQVVDQSRPGLIQLTATLRNHAGYAVGYPALDLVLTNAKQHTLARRVLMPAEYLVESQGENSAGFKVNAEVNVRVVLDTGDLGAAGYRLALLPAKREGIDLLQISPERIRLASPTEIPAQQTPACLEWGVFAASDMGRVDALFNRLALPPERLQRIGAEKFPNQITYYVRDPNEIIIANLAEAQQSQFPGTRIKAAPCPPVKQ